MVKYSLVSNLIHSHNFIIQDLNKIFNMCVSFYVKWECLAFGTYSTIFLLYFLWICFHYKINLKNIRGKNKDILRKKDAKKREKRKNENKQEIKKEENKK